MDTVAQAKRAGPHDERRAAVADVGCKHLNEIVLDPRRRALAGRFPQR
jgi:hypothetical protein